MSKTFQYRSRNADTAKELAQGNASKYHGYIKAGIKIWTPSKELHTIRILPPTYPDPRSFGMRVVVHQNVGPDEKTFICLNGMLEQPDPIEERLSEARRTGQGDEKWAWQMKQKTRVPTWIVDRDDMDSGPQIWPMAEPTDANLNRASINQRTGSMIEIEDPDKGFDIEVETTKKEGKKGEYTNYEFQAVRRSSYLSEDEQEQADWLQYITDNSIDTLLVYETYETLKEAMGEASYGGSGASDSRRGGTTRSERRVGRDPSRDRDRFPDDGPSGSEMPDWTQNQPADDGPMPTSRRRREPTNEREPVRQQQDNTAVDRARDSRREQAPAPAPPPEQAPAPESRRRREPPPEQAPAPESRRRREPPPEQAPAPESRRRAPPPEQAPAPQSRRREQAPAPENPRYAPPLQPAAPEDDDIPFPAALADDQFPPNDQPPVDADIPFPVEAPVAPSGRRRMPPPEAEAPGLAEQVGAAGLPDAPPTRRRRRG